MTRLEGIWNGMYPAEKVEQELVSGRAKASESLTKQCTDGCCKHCFSHLQIFHHSLKFRSCESLSVDVVENVQDPENWPG